MNIVFEGIDGVGKTTIINELPTEKVDATILAVAHNVLKTLDVKSLVKENHIIFDVKGVLDKKIVDGRL